MRQNIGRDQIALNVVRCIGSGRTYLGHDLNETPDLRKLLLRSDHAVLERELVNRAEQGSMFFGQLIEQAGLTSRRRYGLFDEYVNPFPESGLGDRMVSRRWRTYMEDVKLLLGEHFSGVCECRGSSMTGGEILSSSKVVIGDSDNASANALERVRMPASHQTGTGDPRAQIRLDRSSSDWRFSYSPAHFDSVGDH
jgi:hypothetical protein